MVYRNLSAYLKEKFGKRVKKICIDGGFTCPNRDGTCGTGGCIFCGERGAGEHIDGALSIRAQVERELLREKERKYIAYFQNFTNTYADVDTLRNRYDEALISDKICALAIGTRPDCIDEEVAALLASYAKKLDVWVELGLQTANDTTAKIINRGYTSSRFTEAMNILEKYGIPTVVHLIIGLPGETHEEIAKTVDFIVKNKLFGIKIHSLYVMKGTHLATMHERGEYASPDEDFYVSEVKYILTHIPPETVIHRLTGDCPDGALISPLWSKDKNRIIERIRKEMEAEGLYQGIYYKN